MASSYILLNDLRFHYLHWEPEESGRPLLLLHGLASNARIWELVAPELVAEGFSPIAPDLRGHGLSDKPFDMYNFETYRKDLLAFVDAFQLQPPILVGHSWGALLALDYAARFPFGPRSPAGIVLVDGGLTQLSDLPGASWSSVRKQLAPPPLGGTPVEDFLAQLGNWTSSWNDSEQVLQIILANFEIREDETIWPNLTFERHMQILRSIWDFKTYERLAEVRCPVSAVLAVPPERPGHPAGEMDRDFLEIKRRGVARAQEILPGLQVHWLNDTVHDIPLHRPEELANLIIAFIESINGGSHAGG